MVPVKADEGMVFSFIHFGDDLSEIEVIGNRLIEEDTMFGCPGADIGHKDIMPCLVVVIDGFMIAWLGMVA